MSARYDRQIRLWGEAGQEALEGSAVCVVGAGATGVEAAKSLVLGGVGAITIVDGERVKEKHLGQSFFVAEHQLGAPLAQAACELLSELNPSVNTSFVDEHLRELLANRPAFLREFALVIASQLDESSALLLERALSAASRPLLLARSYGLLGTLRPCISHHCVTRIHPDNSLPDLRLCCPWPALHSFALSFDLSNIDDVTHKHVPYVILLIKAIAHFTSQRNSSLPPSTSSERTFFRQLLRSYARESGQVNVNEACRAANKAWQRPHPSAQLQAVIDEARTKRIDSTDNDNLSFWTLALAVDRFIVQDSEGAVPLEGTLPDMTSSTDAYVALQRLYTEKAESDAQAVHRHATNILHEAALDKSSVSFEQAKLFCKNCQHVQALHMQSLESECSLSKGSANARALLSELQSEEKGHTAALYLLLRAADRFRRTHGRSPGESTERSMSVEEDKAKLTSMLHTLLQESGIPHSAFPEDLVAEMVRFGNAELQCVAATIGSVAAQEAIKLLTKQFVPLSGTLCWSFIASKTAVLFEGAS
jgi:amyloid beta precursor protein binding protein 1